MRDRHSLVVTWDKSVNVSYEDSVQSYKGRYTFMHAGVGKELLVNQKLYPLLKVLDRLRNGTYKLNTIPIKEEINGLALNKSNLTLKCVFFETGLLIDVTKLCNA